MLKRSTRPCTPLRRSSGRCSHTCSSSLPSDTPLRPFWVLDDDSSHAAGRSAHGGTAGRQIAIRLYRVEGEEASLTRQAHYVREGRSPTRRASVAADLVRAAGIGPGPLAIDSSFANRQFVQRLADTGIELLISVRPGTQLASGAHEPWTPADKAATAAWQEIPFSAPGSTVIYSAADLATADFAGQAGLRVVSLAPGGIVGFAKGLLTGLWSGGDTNLEELARMLGWIRWIRPIERRLIREQVRSADAPGLAALVPTQTVLSLAVRHNLKTAQKQDAAFALQAEGAEPQPLRGALAAGRTELNVVELFAGAGGMGLGFLLAGAEGAGPRYRLIYSGEINPIYACTLETNHRYLRERGVLPADLVPAGVKAVDHRESAALEAARQAAAEAGGVDVLIGGPPCQGFSTANRNSWSSSNPNNRLVDTFIDYVTALRPRALLMENVQGILWTPRPGDGEEGEEGELSVVGHVARRLGEAGYRIYPKLLDAAWYGVPQYRNRFFLLGLHEDLGYADGSFGAWGPFPARTHGPGTPRRYTTVSEAFDDLPAIGNGETREEVPYQAPAEQSPFLTQIRRWAEDGQITDHVTSRHAAYVIKRYERIREGGNWTDIADLMTNYADIDRTHSNIYRRLVRSEPSITIGHYRKSMLVHPVQHRGLSLREAARLQSFPDWFRFAGTADGRSGGISHKQQQLANAVCPLLSEAVARYLLAV